MSNQHYDEVAFCEYLDGFMPESERAAFERHLGECETCRTMVEEAGLGQAGLKRMQLRTGPDLSPRIMAAIRRLPAPVPAAQEGSGASAGNRRFIGWLSLLASAALAVVLFVSLPRTVPVGPAPGAGHGIRHTSVPVQAVSAQQESLNISIVMAEGRWNSSTQPVEGTFREATSFTTGSDGYLVLTAGSGGCIEIHPGSQVSIDRDRITVETGAVRCEFRPRTSTPAWSLKTGNVNATIVDAAFGVRVASQTSKIELFEGKITLATSASATPVILTAGNRAVCSDRISLETLEETAKHTWESSPRTPGNATASAPRMQTASLATVIETPIEEPLPATGITDIAQPVQPASMTTASPSVVSDDPLSTLLDHQPRSN